MRNRLLQLPRQAKRALQVFADTLLLWAALWLAFVIRLGWERMVDPFGDYLWLFVAAPAAAIPLFVRFGLYRAVLRYFGASALVTIFNAISLSALLLALIIYLMQPEELMPRSVIFIYWALSLLFVGGLRLLMRQYFSGELFPPLARRQPPLTRVAIYGAGSAGNQLLSTLRTGKSMQPVAFIDDDEGIAGRVIGGLKVYKSRQIEQMITITSAEEVLLAHVAAAEALPVDQDAPDVGAAGVVLRQRRHEGAVLGGEDGEVGGAVRRLRRLVVRLDHVWREPLQLVPIAFQPLAEADGARFRPDRAVQPRLDDGLRQPEFRRHAEPLVDLAPLRQERPVLRHVAHQEPAARRVVDHGTRRELQQLRNLVAARVLQLAEQGTITAVDGTELKVDAMSVCVHGDSPGSVAMTQSIVDRLRDRGIEIRSSL